MTRKVLIVAAVLAAAGCGKPSAPTPASAPAEQKQEAAPIVQKEAASAVNVCPMGDYSGPNTKDGRCPKCGMNLKMK